MHYTFEMVGILDKTNTQTLIQSKWDPQLTPLKP